MRNVLLFLTLISLIIISSNYAYSQEISLSTFHEIAQIKIDKNTSQNVTVSIILQSTNVQEIQIPIEFEQKIRENDRIQSIFVTNQEQCVLGVTNQSCILINVLRDPEDKGINAITSSTKEISESYIDEINQIFDTNAEFHSTYIYTENESKSILAISDNSSDEMIIAGVFTMPMEDTNSMYEKISSILIPKTIKDGGGFHNIANNLSFEENSEFLFSLVPLDSKSLLQLKLSNNYPNYVETISEISPLDFFKTDYIHRSDYFSSGFYPINSIIQVIILSPENEKISNINGNIVPTQIIDNEKIPTDVSKEGWIFDPQEGQMIQGKYIFGNEMSISKEKLKFSLEGNEIVQPKTEFDESIAIVIIISIIAIAAAIFFLKGFKK
jgi:hypothetical protein